MSELVKCSFKIATTLQRSNDCAVSTTVYWTASNFSPRFSCRMVGLIID